MKAQPFSLPVDVDLRIEGDRPGDKVDPANGQGEGVQGGRFTDCDTEEDLLDTKVECIRNLLNRIRHRPHLMDAFVMFAYTSE